jgi:hypothetical protein
LAKGDEKMSREFERIEGSVHLVVGKPLAWALYALWLTATRAGRAAACSVRWLRGGWARLQRAA